MTSQSSPPALRLSAVTRRFVTKAEVVTAIDGVTLELAAGELVGLAGPSGSGKTTLLHLVVGWEHPDTGVIELAAGRGDGWTSVAVVPQELGLLQELSARENVELALRLGGCDRPGVGGVFDSLGLGDLAERMPAELSMGEQQRVAVARAVICSPALLVADEPTAHQDERNADRVMALLRAAAGAGAAVVVATHDERLLEGVDRVIRLVDGRIVGG